MEDTNISLSFFKKINWPENSKYNWFAIKEEAKKEHACLIHYL